ncbi:MAG TPA: MFS transporter [Chlamydiales bacterium]|nr:MFS transporter [Chlamydiales bacterium]
MQKIHRNSLFSLFLSYFADYFSWGAAIAFIAVYINTKSTPFTHLVWGEEISVGIAFAAYPIGEVIGSPILGDLSDWIGRKKVLIWGSWGSILSMALAAFSLWIGSFMLFILCQFLIGFFSGKQAMAQAAIVETQTGTKGQKLAFLSVLGGAAWISGPFLGGILMEEPFVSYGGFIWPNLLACAVYVLSLICTKIFFTDTYQPAHRELNSAQFLESIGNIFTLTWKERLFFLFLLNLLGWYLLAVSLSDFLIVRFNLTQAQIGFFSSYVSFCFTLGGVIGTVWILHRWKAKNILFWALLLGSFGLFFLFGAEKVAELWTYLAIPAFTEAWIYPAYQTVLSDHTSEKNQGKLFGLIGASNGACQFLAFVILGGVSSQVSILIAALLFLSSAAILPLLIKKRSRRKVLSQTTA